MALENYSKEAIAAVRFQALDHLFMASDMRKNLENVLHFEECMHQSVLKPEEVYAYLRCMEGFSAFYPRVINNVKEYVSYERDHLPMEQEKRIDITSWLNEMLELCYLNEDIFQSRFLYYRMLQSSNGIVDYAKRFFELNFLNSENNRLILMDKLADVFSTTALLLEDEHDYAYALSGKEQFFHYVNLMAREYPELLQNEDFLTRIEFVLDYNKSLRDLDPDEGEERLSFSFFQKNRKAIGRIRKIAKNEHIDFYD